MEPFVLPAHAAILVNCGPSLNTAWLVVHSPYLRHLREIADEGRYARIAIKQNLCRLLRSACLYRDNKHSRRRCMPILNVIANTIAIFVTIGAHAPAVLPGCLSCQAHLGGNWLQGRRKSRGESFHAPEACTKNFQLIGASPTLA